MKRNDKHTLNTTTLSTRPLSPRPLSFDTYIHSQHDHSLLTDTHAHTLSTQPPHLLTHTHMTRHKVTRLLPYWSTNTFINLCAHSSTSCLPISNTFSRCLNYELTRSLSRRHLGWNSIGYHDYDLGFVTPHLTSLAQQGDTPSRTSPRLIYTPSFVHSHEPSRTHSLTHPLLHPFIHSLTYPLTHPLTPTLIYLRSHPFTFSNIHPTLSCTLVPIFYPKRADAGQLLWSRSVYTILSHPLNVYPFTHILTHPTLSYILLVNFYLKRADAGQLLWSRSMHTILSHPLNVSSQRVPLYISSNTPFHVSSLLFFTRKDLCWTITMVKKCALRLGLLYSLAGILCHWECSMVWWILRYLPSHTLSHPLTPYRALSHSLTLSHTLSCPITRSYTY